MQNDWIVVILAFGDAGLLTAVLLRLYPHARQAYRAVHDHRIPMTSTVKAIASSTKSSSMKRLLVIVALPPACR